MSKIGFDAAKIIIVGFPHRSRFQQRTFRFRLVHRNGQNGGNGADNLILDREDISQFAVVPLGPAVSASYGVNQLRGDANAITGTPDASFEDVTNTQFSPNLPDVNRFPLLLVRRIAGDHHQLGKP